VGQHITTTTAHPYASSRASELDIVERQTTTSHPGTNDDAGTNANANAGDIV
jgi:hypothetical protein